jgi:hypothetical protein
MGRVATWDREVNAWSEWENENKNDEGWEEEVKKVGGLVRTGKIGGDGCGC